MNEDNSNQFILRTKQIRDMIVNENGTVSVGIHAVRKVQLSGSDK